MVLYHRRRAILTRLCSLGSITNDRSAYCLPCLTRCWRRCWYFACLYCCRRYLSACGTRTLARYLRRRLWLFKRCWPNYRWMALRQRTIVRKSCHRYNALALGLLHQPTTRTYCTSRPAHLPTSKHLDAHKQLFGLGCYSSYRFSWCVVSLQCYHLSATRANMGRQPDI